MKKNLVFSGLFYLVIFFIFPVFVQAQNTETLTISTYYPAPTGVYQNLRLFPTAVAPACNANSEGVMYYDNGTNQIMLCQETSPAVFTPVPLGAGFWTFVDNAAPTPDFIYPNNPNWNVGIGTINPNAKLSLTTTGTPLTGTARSTAFNTVAGTLGTTVGDELALASIGFISGNQSSLGIRARRVSAVPWWDGTAIGLGMDVDDTVRAGGASLWFNSNGVVTVTRFQVEKRAANPTNPQEGEIWLIQ